MPRLSEDEARATFLEAGLAPLEPFLGARFNWRCECLKCGHIYSPAFSSIKSGRRCPNCFKAWQASEQQKAGENLARRTCASQNYKLVGVYVNAKTPTSIECLNCSRVFETTLDSLKQKTVKCFCRKTARQLVQDYAPQIYAEIDWEANPSLDPKKIGTGTRAKINWKCMAKSHKFLTSPAVRINNKGTCPVCTGLIPEKGVNDLATLFPSLASQFLEDRISGLTPGDVFPGSQRIFVWQCPRSEKHKFTSSPWARLRGQGCPVCAGKKVIPGDNDLASMNPHLVSEWDFEKNLGLSPTQLTSKSNKRVYWLCKQGHSWVARPGTRAKGHGCEQCFWFEPGRNDLGTLGSDLLRSEWDLAGNGKTLSEVSASDQRKYLWICSGCSQPFSASPANRHFNSTGCSSCAATGFSSSEPSTLYFLENQTLRSFKIGITNTNAKSNRLAGFAKRGWNLVKRWDQDDGEAVEFTERALLTWIRIEMDLPQFLTKGDMRGMAGETETFSVEGLTTHEVCAKAEYFLAHWGELKRD